MTPANKLRKLEIQMPSGNWVRATMGQVEKGDVFRLFDSETGEPLVWKGQTVFKAKSPAFVDAEPLEIPSKLKETTP